MLNIDGSYNEGGGQIIRTATALSCLTHIPVQIQNIRAGRINPGLQAQRLAGVNAVAALCQADMQGAKKGSTTLTFTPQIYAPQNIQIDIGTAGSVILVLQSLLLASVHSKKPVTFIISGGTHVPFAPTTDYFQHVFSFFLQLMGCTIESVTDLIGFYPKGGGKITVTFSPKLKPVVLTKRGELKHTAGFSLASATLRQAKVAERQLRGTGLSFQNQKIHYSQTCSPGSALHLHNSYTTTILGVDVLGKRGLKAESVGKQAAALLKKQTQTHACLDEWMGDQILPYMALAGSGSVSVSRLTNHQLTTIWVIEQFLPVKFHIDRANSIISL